MIFIFMPAKVHHFGFYFFGRPGRLSVLVLVPKAVFRNGRGVAPLSLSPACYTSAFTTGRCHSNPCRFRLP